MSAKIFTHINQLINVRQQSHLLRGKQLAELPVIRDAYLVIEDGIIAEFGEMKNLKRKFTSEVSYDEAILPCWCDSHTHIVFAGSRENEFVERIKGVGYAEIAEKGGGILSSVKKLHHTSEDELFNQAWKRLQEVIKLGTGAIEIKSGYGLTTEEELKM